MSQSKATPPRTTMPSLVAVKRAIADYHTRDAIEAYEAALRIRDELRESVGDDVSEEDDVEVWNAINDGRIEGARRHLIRVLVARSHPDIGYEARVADERPYPPSGVTYRGKLYLATRKE